MFPMVNGEVMLVVDDGIPNHSQVVHILDRMLPQKSCELFHVTITKLLSFKDMFTIWMLVQKCP